MRGALILTADEMRAAEARAVASGISVETLMERAGAGAAEAIWRFAGDRPALVLCGPGNNGGDGYVIARILRERGMKVVVAASADSVSEAAIAARRRWDGEVVAIASAEPADLLVDALFGTGLGRPLDPSLVTEVNRLSQAADVRIAIDLPSGVATDDGRILSPVPTQAMTITFQTLKPSHRLQPAATTMGRLVVVDIGVKAESHVRSIQRPSLPAPGPQDHKYKRGYVAVVGGPMAGASTLAAAAALRAGAGYVRLVGGAPSAGLPSSVVVGSASFDDSRVDATLIGPGLGTGADSAERLDRVLGSTARLVLDADALNLLAMRSPPAFTRPVILTPHAGEFSRLFGELGGSKIDQAREAARRTGAVVLFKGADSVVAAPDGRAALAPPAPHWLASAGTGDVLAGIVAARLAATNDAFDAACEGVWMHGRAAWFAGPGLIADDLVAALPRVLAELAQ